jgi:hypothetical protein
MSFITISILLCVFFWAINVMADLSGIHSQLKEINSKLKKN